jgi:hypothetical protein
VLWLLCGGAASYTFSAILNTTNDPENSRKDAKNIKFGFLVTGIWLFNTNTFTGEDLLPSAVTD